jgi:hypothetical protein
MIVAALAAGACDTNTPTYVAPDQAVEITGDATTASTEVKLAFRAPTDAERKQLGEAEKKLGFKVPWLKRDDVALSIEYKITNLDDKANAVAVFVDGADEYTSFDAAAAAAALQMATMDRDPPFVPSLIRTVPVTVAPGASVSGVVREDDFREAEADLDALGRWKADPPLAVLINRSDVDPTGMAMVPKNVVTPAMWQLKVTLSATGKARLEFVVRVRDHGLLRENDEPTFSPSPAVYMLPVPAMM